VRLVARGIAAGLGAGLVTAVLFRVTGEPLLDAAIELEAHTHGGAAVVDRGTQAGIGLFLALGLTGTCLGALLAAATKSFGGALPAGAALYASIVLVPFLKYPPTPPGAAGEATTGALFLVLIVATALLALLCRRLLRPLPGLLAFAASVAVLLLVMPASGADTSSLPSQLLLDFRVTSLAGTTTLWLLMTSALAVRS
jgi:hypothetical protein